MKKYCIALIILILILPLVSACAESQVTPSAASEETVRPPVEDKTMPAPVPEPVPSPAQAPAREPLYTFIDSSVQAAVERLLDKSEELSQEDLGALRTVRGLSVQSYWSVDSIRSVGDIIALFPSLRYLDIEFGDGISDAVYKELAAMALPALNVYSATGFSQYDFIRHSRYVSLNCGAAHRGERG